VLGAIGGLAGTWLGIRVPQLMAPTMTERRLLEREGRVIWRLALIFLFATLASVALTLWFAARPNAVMYAVLGNMAMGVAFAAICIIRGVRLNGQIKKIRREISPEQDPNPTWLKDRMGLANEPGKAKWVGRRATSKRQLLGWPIYDFQVSDPSSQQSSSDARHAKGWIAVGDKATGFVAIGHYARGIFAFGGRSLGVVSFGGVSMGLVSFGGVALGLLAIGGGAIGHSAIGGGAIGWQAAGGGAFGIYSANGGLAISGNIAEGGLAISWKYAVGGEARAPEANTEIARSECSKSWVAEYLNTQTIANNPQAFQTNAMIYGTIVPVAFSVLFAVCVPMLMYRRNEQKIDA
jgi:zinc protease